jgi:hemerythrin-like domain-containing protein
MGNAILAAWHSDHARFGTLLARLRPQLDVLHDGGRPDYEGMAAIVAELREYGDKVHHPREDAAFARLARRCPDLALPIARLQQEHRVIAHAGETLLGLIEEILDGAIVPRQQVEVALATYLVYYGNHIAKEEEDFLPRAAKALTPEDWSGIL